MNTSKIEPLAYDLKIDDETITVYLKDGRTILVPLLWYPSLANATQEQRENFEILGDGEGFHWIDLDEDLSVQGFLDGISLEKNVA